MGIKIRDIVIGVTYVYMILNISSALEYNQECVPGNTTHKCNETIHLECIKEYNGDLTGKCLCPSGSHWENLVSGECRGNVGESCGVGSIAMECALNADCGAENICTCTAGFVATNDWGFERCSGSIGTSCAPPVGSSVLKRCNVQNGLGCNSATHTCECSQTFPSVWSSVRQKCLMKYRVNCGHLGNADDECVENSYCSTYCQCFDGYMPGVDGLCYLDYGQPCGGPIETPCTASTECIGGKCDCPVGTKINLERRVCENLAGGDCSYDRDCWYGFCHPITKKCTCKSNQLELIDKSCGDMTTKDGGYCRSNSDCVAKAFLTCHFNVTGAPHYGICGCEDGMIFERSNCRIGIGEDCSRNRNCVGNAQCIERICRSPSPIIDDTFEIISDALCDDEDEFGACYSA